MNENDPEYVSGPVTVTVAEVDVGQRLDAVLARHVTGLSRARLQRLIEDGHVSSLGGGTIRAARHKVMPGQSYTVSIPDARPAAAAGEPIPLNVVYEDSDVIVIDKPAGLVVHPAAGHAAGTLVNALIAHCGTSLSGIGGVARPGIVHRLDKDTSGLLVAAKNDAAHHALSDQFRSHGRDGRLTRVYLALVWGEMTRPKGTIDAPLARSTQNRKKIAVSHSARSREAKTHYEVVEVFGRRPKGAVLSLLRLTLETGRTHQIRVHLAHTGHPVLGDPVYAASFKTRVLAIPPELKGSVERLNRQALHAAKLGFEHPRSHKKLIFESSLPVDIARVIEAARTALENRRNVPK